MKPIAICLALAFSALPAAAQTPPVLDAASHPALSVAEIVRRVNASGIRRGSGGFNITPQEKARVEAGMAKVNELNRAGVEALHSKNFVAAETDYRELVQMQSDIPNYYYGLGEALAGQGKTADALAAYKTAVDWPRNSPEGQLALSRAGDNRPNLRGCGGGTDTVAWMKYALLLSQTGQNAEAFSIYSQAIVWVNDLNRSGITLFSGAGPASPAEFQAAAYIALGLLTGGMLTDHEQAMTEFDQALRLAPDSEAANYYYGYGWRRLDLNSKIKAADAVQAKAALVKAAHSENAAVKAAAEKALKAAG